MSNFQENRGRKRGKKRKIAEIKEKRGNYSRFAKIEENSENRGKWVP